METKACRFLNVLLFTATLIVGGVLRVKHTLGQFTLQIATSTIIQEELPPLNEVRKERQTLFT